jgi:hypothetical protein
VGRTKYGTLPLSPSQGWPKYNLVSYKCERVWFHLYFFNSQFPFAQTLSFLLLLVAQILIPFHSLKKNLILYLDKVDSTRRVIEYLFLCLPQK